MGWALPPVLPFSFLLVKYLSKPRGSFLKSGTQEIRNFVFEKTEIGRCRDSDKKDVDRHRGTKELRNACCAKASARRAVALSRLARRADFGIIYRRDKYIRVSR